MSNDEQQSKSELEANMKARFEQLDAQSRESQAQEASVKASYHHSSEQDTKDVRAMMEASAEKERENAKPKLDPLELIRQLAKMREEGFDEATIRAAFDEVMGELTGNFRRPMRRILKSEGMVATLSQPEINKLYTDRYKDIVDEANPTAKMILDAMEKSREASERILEYRKPSLKNYLFRAVLFVIRRPLQFAINFLSAYRTAKYRSKNGYYDENIGIGKSRR